MLRGVCNVCEEIQAIEHEEYRLIFMMYEDITSKVVHDARSNDECSGITGKL